MSRIIFLLRTFYEFFPPSFINVIRRFLVLSWLLVCAILGFVHYSSGEDFLKIPKQQSTGIESNTDENAKLNRNVDLRFVRVSTSDGISDDKSFWTKYELRVSDGHTLYEEIAPYSTTGRAKQEFRKYVNNAKSVIRCDEERNAKGQVVGERALLLYPKAESAGERYHLIWTTGKVFHRITGVDLPDVIALENRQKGKSLLIVLAEDAENSK